METTGAFLKALAFQPNTDINKVRGLKKGILVHDRENLLFKGDTKHYFPHNTSDERIQTKTQIKTISPYAGALMILMLMMTPLGSSRLSLRASLFCCPDLNNYKPEA